MEPLQFVWVPAQVRSDLCAFSFQTSTPTVGFPRSEPRTRRSGSLRHARPRIFSDWESSAAESGLMLRPSFGHGVGVGVSSSTLNASMSNKSTRTLPDLVAHQHAHKRSAHSARERVRNCRRVFFASTRPGYPSPQIELHTCDAGCVYSFRSWPIHHGPRYLYFSARKRAHIRRMNKRSSCASQSSPCR